MANNSVLAKMAIQISADAAGFNRALSATQTNLQKFTGQVTSLANTLGFAFGATAIFGGLKYGLGIISDFESRMSEVRAITQASSKEFEALRNSALALGKSTKFTAEEVGQLQVEYGKLGFTTKEILAATEATLQLSVATGEDLAKSADIAGSTLRAFNLDATEMQRVVDVMASSFNKSALGLENFGEAMKYVAPVAAAANISLEETTAMLGVLADAGIRGSMAGTSLRKIISDVGGESGTLTERLQKLAEKGLTGAGAMDEVGRTAYASLLVLTKHVDKVNDATEAYKNANGEAQKMADLMGDNLEGDVKKLNSAFESLILSGGGISTTLRELVQGLTDLINVLNSSGFIKAVSEGLGALLKQALIIPNIVKAIKEYNKATESAHGAQTTWTEEIEKTTAALTDTTITLDTLKAKRDALNDAFDQTDINDKAKLLNIGDEIRATEALIAELEALKIARLSAAANRAIGDQNPLTKTKDITDAKITGDLGIGNVASQVEKAASRIDVALINNTQTIESWGESMRIKADLFAQKMIDIGPIIADTISGIAESFGQLAADGNVDDFGKNILKAVANFAKQLGGLFIATGLAEIAFQSGNPYAMVIAGAALVALGAAISGMLDQQKKGVGGIGANSGSRSANDRILTGREVRINFNGEFVARGNDLVAVIDNTTRQNGRLRG